MNIRRILSWIHDNQRFATAIVIFLVILDPVSAQVSCATSNATSKTRLTQAEWYRQKAIEDAERRVAIKEAAMSEKKIGMAKKNCSYGSNEKRLQSAPSFAADSIYELPAVKELGIKPPPRNRLKSDSFGSAQERDRAQFLNKQNLRHREITFRLVNFSQHYPRYSTSRVSIQKLVSDLNRVVTSSAWKRMANSNTRPLFAGEDKRFRDEISGGLSSVDGSLGNLEYSVTHNGEPNSIVQVFGDTPSDLPIGWSTLPADRRQRKLNWKLMQSENAAARDQYIRNHPEDPHANHFVSPMVIDSDGHIIKNPNLPSYPVCP